MILQPSRNGPEISPEGTIPKTDISNYISEIIEHSPYISITFYPPFTEKLLFTGNGGWYTDTKERSEICQRQKQNFLDSGYTSYCGKDGLSATGFSLVSERFLKTFKSKNRGMPGFTAGNGRPTIAGNFNFLDINSVAIGKASYIDENNSEITVSLYLLGKNGEGVLSKKQIQKFLSLITE